MTTKAILRIAVVIGLSLLAKMTSSAQSESSFEEANQLYYQEDYSSAANLYESILEAKRDSKELYFNLGNCYFKLDQIGPTILNYEKALLLDSRYDAAKNNLQLAQKRVVDDIEPIPELGITRFFRTLLNIFSLSSWGLLCIIGAIVFLAANIALFVLGRRKELIRLVWICFFFWAFVAAATFSAKRLQKEEWVLIEDNAYIKTGPNESSTDLFILHAGTKVQHMDDSKDDLWMQLKLADGHIGWADKSKFRSIH